MLVECSSPRLTTALVFLAAFLGACNLRYTPLVRGTNPFDPIGAYGENPEWERSSRIHLLSVAKEAFLLRSGTKDFLHKHHTPTVRPWTPPGHVLGENSFETLYSLA